MKTRQKKLNTCAVAFMTSVAAFTLLTVFTDGFVQVSPEVGLAGWLRDVMVYSVAYKFGYKLAASVFFAAVVCFVRSMISYGQSARTKKRARATAIRFTPTDSGVGRIA